MSSDRFATLLAVCLVKPVIKLIVEKEGVDLMTAIKGFYESQTYHYLSIPESGVWHYSHLTLYDVYRREGESGLIDFPEEAA